MKRMIILLFCFLSTASLSSFSDQELIRKVDHIVNDSLLRFTKMGKLGTEQIGDMETGYIKYNTVLSGLGSVINTIEYYNFQEDEFIINGTIRNKTNWIGTGTSISDFDILGIEKFKLFIEVKLYKKKKTEGYCIITKSGGYIKRYPYIIQ